MYHKEVLSACAQSSCCYFVSKMRTWNKKGADILRIVQVGTSLTIEQGTDVLPVFRQFDNVYRQLATSTLE